MATQKRGEQYYEDNGRTIHKQSWVDDETGEEWDTFDDVGPAQAPQPQAPTVEAQDSGQPIPSQPQGGGGISVSEIDSGGGGYTPPAPGPAPTGISTTQTDSGSRTATTRASDGQSLADQPTEVQQIFQSVHGDTAAQVWAAEHTKNLGGFAPTGTAATGAVAPGAPPAAAPTGRITVSGLDQEPPRTGAGAPSASVSAELYKARVEATKAIYEQFKAQGKTVVMTWDPNADGPGLGNFVPTGETMDTFEAINKKLEQSREAIKAVVEAATATGKVPQLRVGANGQLELARDAGGNLLTGESETSRTARSTRAQAAGASIGFVPTGLMQHGSLGENTNMGFTPQLGTESANFSLMDRARPRQGTPGLAELLMRQRTPQPSPAMPGPSGPLPPLPTLPAPPARQRPRFSLPPLQDNLLSRWMRGGR